MIVEYVEVLYQDRTRLRSVGVVFSKSAAMHTDSWLFPYNYLLFPLGSQVHSYYLIIEFFTLSLHNTTSHSSLCCYGVFLSKFNQWKIKKVVDYSSILLVKAADIVLRH